MESVETFGIKEKEFKKILKLEPIYILSQFGMILYDNSNILNKKKFDELV